MFFEIEILENRVIQVNILMKPTPSKSIIAVLMVCLVVYETNAIIVKSSFDLIFSRPRIIDNFKN